MSVSLTHRQVVGISNGKSSEMSLTVPSLNFS